MRNTPMSKPVRSELSASEANAVIRLLAIISEYEGAEEILRKRSKDAGVDKVLDAANRDNVLAARQIMNTIPKDKLQQFSAVLDNISVRIDISKDVDEYPKSYVANKHYDFLCVPRETVNYMLNYIMENECVICNKTGKEIHDCPYRKHVDSTYMYKLDEEDGENCKFATMHYLVD